MTDMILRSGCTYLFSCAKGGCDTIDICAAVNACGSEGLSPATDKVAPGGGTGGSPIRDFADIDRAKAAEYFRKQRVSI